MQLSDRSDTGDSVNPESTATAKQHVPLEPGTQTMATELRNQEPTEVEHCDPVPAAQVTLKVPQVHTGESRLGREPDLEQMEQTCRSQRVRQPPRMFTYYTLGQPIIYSVKTGSNPLPGWYYLPLQSPWTPCTYPYLGLPCYRPLVYPPYTPIP